MSHFSRDELIRSKIAQERGILNVPPEAIMLAIDFTRASLDRVRAALRSSPVHITSGYRSPALNEAVGGSRNSQHILGQAADFTCPAFGDPQKIFDQLSPMMRLIGIDQLILERTWIHVSFTLEPRYQAFRLNGA